MASDDVASLVASIASADKSQIKAVTHWVERLQARHDALLTFYQECEAILQCM